MDIHTDPSSCLVMESSEGTECVIWEEEESAIEAGVHSYAFNWEDAELAAKPTPPQRRKPFKGLRRFFTGQRQESKQALEEYSVGSSTTATTVCSSVVDDDDDLDDDIGDDNEAGVEVPLMQQRLFATGVIQSVDDFSFTTDKVSKEVKHLYANDEANDKAVAANITHVKTGVWQVNTFQADRTNQQPYYIVTAVSMDDRVDTKKLRKAVFRDQHHMRRPKLAMAPTPIAEELTGYQSGTMAPICHTVPMKMFMEETIASKEPDHQLWMGSGMFGKCLAISTEKCVAIAQQNKEGFVPCPLIQKRLRVGKQ